MEFDNPYGGEDSQMKDGDSTVLFIDDHSPIRSFWRMVAFGSAAMALWLTFKTYGDLAIWYFDSTSLDLYGFSSTYRGVVSAIAEFAFAGILATAALVVGYLVKMERLSFGFLWIRMIFVSWVLLLLCYSFVRV